MPPVSSAPACLLWRFYRRSMYTRVWQRSNLGNCNSFLRDIDIQFFFRYYFKNIQWINPHLANLISSLIACITVLFIASIHSTISGRWWSHASTIIRPLTRITCHKVGPQEEKGEVIPSLTRREEKKKNPPRKVKGRMLFTRSVKDVQLLCPWSNESRDKKVKIPPSSCPT